MLSGEGSLRFFLPRKGSLVSEYSLGSAADDIGFLVFGSIRSRTPLGRI